MGTCTQTDVQRMFLVTVLTTGEPGSGWTRWFSVLPKLMRTGRNGAVDEGKTDSLVTGRPFTLRHAVPELLFFNVDALMSVLNVYVFSTRCMLFPHTLYSHLGIMHRQIVGHNQIVFFNRWFMLDVSKWDTVYTCTKLPYRLYDANFLRPWVPYFIKHFKSLLKKCYFLLFKIC